MTTPLRSVTDLINAGLVEAAEEQALQSVAQRYTIAITPEIEALIDKTDPLDPIARQFVPQTLELQTKPEEMPDPIGDHAHAPVKGIVHRYPDRVLLKAVHTCPVYCRFCFRREMVGTDGDGTLTEKELAAALTYIGRHSDIWEVILTGGDPLILSNRRLGRIMDALAAINHVRIIRIHSRVPVASPGRITQDLINALLKAKKTIYIAIHANHPRELSDAMRSSCADLVKAGFFLLGQTVLLRDVNDNPEILANLMRGFVETGIRPYYLHHPDLAPGTSHFRLSIDEGNTIVEQLRGKISGLCQPTYILDIPGGYGKSPLGSNYIDKSADGEYKIKDYRGHWHSYPPATK